MPDSDDFDRQLRDLTSGQAEPAKFQELSAAERARRAPTPPPSPSRLNWRKARKAKKLRKPVSDSDGKRPGPSQPKRKTPSMASRTPAARRKARFLQVLRTVGVLIAFAALLYGLHLLGFGPS